MTVTLPDADAGFSRSKIQRKGLRHGSFRIVIETNKRARGGYQLVSDGFVKGEIEVEPGACIAWQDPERDWRIGMVLPNKKIEWRTDWLTNARMPTIRKAAEAILSNPRREMRKVLEKLRKQLRSAESDAQTTRAKDNDVGGPEDGQADRSRGTEADRSDQKVLKAKSALEALESWMKAAEGQKIRTVVVSRHPGTIIALQEMGLIDDDATVISHVTETGQIAGAHVIGNLPAKLAAHATLVTSLVSRVPAELRGVDLNADQVRACLERPATFTYRVLTQSTAAQLAAQIDNHSRPGVGRDLLGPIAEPPDDQQEEDPDS